MKTLHAFVAMPFGKKTGPDGTAICFNAANKNKLPKSFVEPAFIQKSVFPGGRSRRERYFKFKPQAQITATPIESDKPPKDVKPYERSNLTDFFRFNLWLLYIAINYGIKKIQFCLWNGEGGDASGGTAHIYHHLNDKTGQVYWLDTRKLW